MTPKMIVAAVALFLGATSAALAQADFTTGTAGSDQSAGYPTANGYGANLYAYAPGYSGPYAYAPGYRYGRFARAHRW